MRRTSRRKSQQNTLVGILGLLCAEQNAENLKNMHFLGIVRLLCAEPNVGNRNKCAFKNSGTPVRRPTRRKSEQMYSTFRNSATPVRRTKHR